MCEEGEKDQREGISWIPDRFLGGVGNLGLGLGFKEWWENSKIMEKRTMMGKVDACLGSINKEVRVAVLWYAQFLPHLQTPNKLSEAGGNRDGGTSSK